VSQSSLTPLHVPRVVRKKTPHSGNTTAAKKRQRLKHTIMSLPEQGIVFLGRTFSGHHHDYSMFQQEFPPELDWFPDRHVRVDLGYLGRQSDYRSERIAIPTKKPRKRKKPPHPPWSDAQKAAHTALSRVRNCMEHASGGMQRSTILVQVFRNRTVDFEDEAVGVCAGLWNFALSY
jgi:hypothetical protein